MRDPFGTFHGPSAARLVHFMAPAPSFSFLLFQWVCQYSVLDTFLSGGPLLLGALSLAALYPCSFSLRLLRE